MLAEPACTLVGVANTAYPRIMDYLAKAGVPHRTISTVRAAGSLTATGNPTCHAADNHNCDACDFAGVKASWDSPELLAINLAFEPIGHLLHELIYSGPGAKQFYRGKPHVYSGVTRKNHHNHVHVSILESTILPDPPGYTAPQEDDMPGYLFAAGPDWYYSDGVLAFHVPNPTVLREVETKMKPLNIGAVSDALFQKLVSRSAQIDNMDLTLKKILAEVAND